MFIVAKNRSSHLSAVRIAGEEVDDALHRPARGCFARVHPCGDDDSPFPAYLIVVHRCGDRQVVDAVAGQTAAEQAQLGKARLCRVGCDLAEIFLVCSSCAIRNEDEEIRYATTRNKRASAIGWESHDKA
jgi:hypothetical protein